MYFVEHWKHVPTAICRVILNGKTSVVIKDKVYWKALHKTLFVPGNASVEANTISGSSNAINMNSTSNNNMGSNTTIGNRRVRAIKKPPPIQTSTCKEYDYHTYEQIMHPTKSPDNIRQDSSISSDGYFSQTSSPSYTVRSMETPLLPHIKNKKKYNIAKISLEGKGEEIDTGISSLEACSGNVSPLIKSHSTPACLQAVVKMHNDTSSNMSLHHRVLLSHQNSRFLALKSPCMFVAYLDTISELSHMMLQLLF